MVDASYEDAVDAASFFRRHGQPLKTTRRLGLVSLVCRHCQQLACSPELLHTVDASLEGNDDDDDGFLARLESFSQWMLGRAAGHVRCLSLRLWVPTCYAPEGEAFRQSAGINSELTGLLAGCSVAAAHGEPLQEVRLLLHNLQQPLHLGSWVAELGRGGLRSLIIKFRAWEAGYVEQEAFLGTQLFSLPALNWNWEELRIEHCPVSRLMPNVRAVCCSGGVCMQCMVSPLVLSSCIACSPTLSHITLQVRLPPTLTTLHYNISRGSSVRTAATAGRAAGAGD